MHHFSRRTMWVLLGGALALLCRFFFFFFMPGSVRAKCEQKDSQSNLCRGGQLHPPGVKPSQSGGLSPPFALLLTVHQSWRTRVPLGIGRISNPSGERERESPSVFHIICIALRTLSCIFLLCGVYSAAGLLTVCQRRLRRSVLIPQCCG